MTQQNQAVTVQEQHLPTISSKVMFWRPRYLADSQWLQHIPFYFWLTEALKPQVVVQPSLNSAVGYFALCQAIDKLNLDSFAYGAFSPKCDVEKVKAYNHENYREFSQLSDLDENTMLREFDRGSIDLLILKHDCELLTSDKGRQELKERLTDSAVVLIHGTKLKHVRKLCQTLSKTYPSFELTQCQGLLLLCMGSQIPERLEALINQSKDVSAQRLIQNIYARLGSANEDAWHRQVYERRVHDLTEKLQQQTHTIQQIQGAKQTLSETLEQANNDIQAAKSQQAKLSERLEQFGEETELNQQQKQQLEREKAQLDKELAQLKISRQDATSEIAKLQQDIDTRFDEVAKLTQMLVEAEARLESLQKENQELREALRNNKTLQEQTRSDVAQKQSHIDQLQTKVSAHQQENEQLRKALQRHQQQEEGQQSELNKLKQQNALLERDQKVAADKISSLAQSELSLQKSLSERFDELATLTNLLQQKERELSGLIEQMKDSEKALTDSKPINNGNIKKTITALKQRRKKARQFAKDVEVIRQSDLFDEAWYLQQYPDAAKHKHGAAGHYLERAVELEVNPSTAFDGNWYLKTHEDVKSAGMNPLFHYLKFGHKESRLFKHLQVKHPN
ncbi:hypothetical protein [Ferrimonas balearica]|nr:hypothetical protein [Ferrimonas balearica]